MRYVAAVLVLVVSGFSQTSSVVSAFRRTVSVWTGVYTAAQADAGEKTYYARCSTCHGDDLGGREQAPALAGPQFVDAWDGKDLRLILDRIAAMPPADPKKLTPSESLELLAFLLRSSEMPSGSTALSADRALLAEIRFERKK